MNSLATPSSKIGAEFLDVDGDIMRVQQVIGSESFGIKFASTYREFPNTQAPVVALAILTAAGLIKPAGLVAEDETQGHRRQTIDGEYYSANDDPQFWVGSVDRTMVAFLNEAQYLVRSTAVRDYFAAEAAAQELTKRRDDLAAKLFDLPVYELHPGPFTYFDSTEVVRNAIDMIIQLQDEAKK